MDIPVELLKNAAAVVLVALGIFLFCYATVPRWKWRSIMFQIKEWVYLLLIIVGMLTIVLGYLLVWVGIPFLLFLGLCRFIFGWPS